MKRTREIIALVCVLAMGACEATSNASIPTGAEADAIVAQIEAMVDGLIDSANRVDAEAVLAPAAGEDSLSLVVGDVLLRGYDTILEDFQESYAELQSQDHTLIDREIRVLSPDVALAILTAVGTYTDLAGWTSEPVGLGVTLVLLRRGDQWRLAHAHQSFID